MAQAPPLTLTAPFRDPAPIRKEGPSAAVNRPENTLRRHGKRNTIRNYSRAPLTHRRSPQPSREQETAMNQAPENGQYKGEEHIGNSPESIPESTIYTYNMDDSKTPGGLKVRWKVRVITGPAAAGYDARQNAAIRELLQWACQQQQRRR
jgi:hypothetical protein